MSQRTWYLVALLTAIGAALPACGNNVVESPSTSSSSSGGGTSSSTTSTGGGAGGAGGGPSCGDGEVSVAEECDDGNLDDGDGCTISCEVEQGFSCAGSPSVCVTTCGDGITAGSEGCDDGNLTANDGCSGACMVEKGFSCDGSPSVCTTGCGDGILAGKEQCDDGNTMDGDGCSAACTLEMGWICGDGVVGAKEQCDDGNTMSGDGCSAGCAPEVGYACSGSPSVCAPVCGDGIVIGGEQCDDGNTNGGDCCSAACQAEAGCEVEINDTIAQANVFATLAQGGKVKGFIQPGTDKDVYAVEVPPNAKATLTATVLDGPLGKMCTGNQLDSYLTLYDKNGGTLGTDDDSGAGFCSMLTASALGAGTYYVEVKKSQFTGPTTTFDYTLQVSLSFSICGNGAKETGEACDDGNLTSGDGCSSQCLLESSPGEVEPNDTFAQADANAASTPALLFTGDALVAGSIGQAGDKDTFKLVLAQPAVIRFETFDLSLDDCTSATKTKLTLFNASFLQVATDTQNGISTCSAIVYSLAAGTYYVQVAGATTTTTVPGYYLELKAQADAGAEAEPNETLATAAPWTGDNAWVSADHTMNGDADFYAITVPAGKSIRAEIIEGAGSAETCESGGMDSRLTLYDAATVQLADDDDNGRGLCSCLDGTGSAPVHPGAHALAAGTYYLRVAASNFAQMNAAGQFVYRLQVTLR